MVTSSALNGSSGCPTRRSTVSCRSDRSPSRGRNGFGVSGRLRGQSRVPPPPARMTAYTAPSYRGWRPGGSERRWRDAEEQPGDAGTRVLVPMRDARRIRHGIARLEEVVLRPDPQLEPALQDDEHLLIGVMRVRLLTRAAARL